MELHGQLRMENGLHTEVSVKRPGKLDYQESFGTA